jgi:uncharacterized protein
MLCWLAVVPGRRAKGGGMTPRAGEPLGRPPVDAALGAGRRAIRSLRSTLSGSMLLGAIIVGLLGGVSSAIAKQGPVVSLLEMRHQDVVVQHYDISCGAAALATILDYQFGEHFTEKQVAEGLIERKEYIEHPELLRIRQGFSLLDMKRFVERLGFMGVGYGKLELKDVLRLAPIIVAMRPIGYNHFVVFRGKIGNQVLLADPAFGNRTMSVENFEREWINFPQFGKVGFIVTRNGKPAPPGALAVRPQLFIAPPPGFVRQALFR